MEKFQATNEDIERSINWYGFCLIFLRRNHQGSTCLARNANIVHSKAFEMGFVKFLSDLESDLLSDPVERKIWQRTQEVRAFQYMDLHMAPLSLIVC